MPLKALALLLFSLVIADYFHLLEPRLIPNNKSVILYSTSWCRYCDQARDFFTRQNIHFIEKDIERDPIARQEYEQYHGQGVPLIVINDTLMQGFQARRFQQLYEK